MRKRESTPFPESDADLVRRSRDGDEGALRELLETIAPRVYRWCLARTGDPADAEDLRQDVLVRVVRRIGSFRGEARFTSWLYQVVRHAALDDQRRRRRREIREEESEMGPRPRSTPEPGLDLDRRRLLDRVRDSFLDLPERQREVFELVELEGISAADAAKRLGIAPSTVRVNLLRSRRAIREAILRSDPELVEGFLT